MSNLCAHVNEFDVRDCGIHNSLVRLFVKINALLEIFHGFLSSRGQPKGVKRKTPQVTAHRETRQPPETCQHNRESAFWC
mgnify:CR=1 FL=1